MDKDFQGDGTVLIGDFLSIEEAAVESPSGHSGRKIQCELPVMDLSGA